MNEETQKRIDLWLGDQFDSQTHAEIHHLQQTDPKSLYEAFCKQLEFGTGGLRGLMGVGSHRLNSYTIQIATQGVANYLLKTIHKKEYRIAISYDSRHHSKEFAQQTAAVLSGNGIHVYLFDSLHPTPLASFACRYYQCDAAIMITASHNPAEYNGYKVYWNDGAQVVDPHAAGIIKEVNAIASPAMIRKEVFPNSLIHFIGPELDSIYLETIAALQHYPSCNACEGKTLSIVYTSLHGTGIVLVPDILKRWGFSQLTLVEEQCLADGNFPTVKSPNPENLTALQMGIEKLLDIDGDILIANDPDADRAAIVIRELDGIRHFSGSQIAALCTEHILRARFEQKQLPPNSYIVKTFVTTRLVEAIAKSYGVECFDVLPGFKYIAQIIREHEERLFIFGAEESYGYLLGDQTRDKDGISACALFAEMALQAKLRGKTLYQDLLDIFKKHGVYREKLLSIQFEETQSGRDKIASAMKQIQSDPPRELLGVKLIRVDQTIPNVLALYLADETVIYIRPSGTEPTIKIYSSVYCKINDKVSVEDLIEHGDTLADNYLSIIKMFLNRF